MAAGKAVPGARPIRITTCGLAFAFALAILVATLSPGAAAEPACDRVASPTGSDSAPGTEQQPFRTAGRLLGSLAAGQSGCLRKGSYRESLNVTRGGRPGAPVRLTSYPGEQVEIIGQMWIGAVHVEIRQLRLVGTGAANGPSPLIAAGNVLLRDNEITNRNSGDCVAIGTAQRRVADVAVVGNRIHDCGVLPPTNRHNAISVENATGTDITHNLVYENADRGVQLFPNADDSLVAYNVIDANGEGVLVAGNALATADRNVVEHNIITGSRVRDNVESTWAPESRVGESNLVRWNCISGGVRDDGDGGIADLRRGFTAMRNLIADPEYINRAAHDYRLRQTSRCRFALGDRPALTCNKVAAPWGSDSAPGTASAPFATVNRLADALAPGQTGCVRAGTYAEQVSIGTGGNAQAPITIASHPGERARIVGRLVVSEAANFVNLVGLDLDGTNDQRLPSPTVNGDDITFTGNDVTNNHTSICFVLGSNTYGRARRPVIQSNRIHNCGELPATNHHHGIYVEASDDATIVDNWIHDNADRGVQLYPDSQRSYIARNVIDSNGQGVIFSRESAGNVVEHNIISNAMLRWNVEQHELTGTGNFARRNCVWATAGRYSENGGVQPTADFVTFKNDVADPRFVGRAAKDFRLPLGSPCLAQYISPLMIPGAG
jgi:nitrous oxidase accessory protein NosD